MTTHRVAGAALALAILGAGALAADALKSGPQVGESVEAFEPLNVTGPYAGGKRCLV
jgi:hypothetical protein